MSFGRHFIFTSSENCDYCLLLINDNLIKKFRYTVSSSSSSSQQQPISLLVSSVTSDRTLHASLSASSSNSTSSSSNSSTTKASSSSNENNNTDKQLNSFILLKFDKINKMSHLWQINRIVQPSNPVNEMDATYSSGSSALSTTTVPGSNVAATTKSLKIGSNKYLSFAINNLMFVLWEGLFSIS